MHRRTFIGGIASGLLAVALAARAQQQPGKVWRVGFLGASSRQYLADTGRYDAFLQGMRELGYIEGKNLVIEARFADGNYERLAPFATELVQLNVDIIVAVPSPAIRAAQRATTTIPIVFPTTGDPVGSGFAASLAHPGGNLTGLSNLNLEVSAKTLELPLTVVPMISRIAILANPGSSTEPGMLKSIGAAATKAGVESMVIEAGTAEGIEEGFARMRRERTTALIIATEVFLSQQRQQIAELAIKSRLPSIAQNPDYAKAGGLMSYGQNSTESYRRSAAYVDKILRGAKPSDLPIEQATKLGLVINLRTAKALGLTIPQSLLLRADEVIQ